MGSQHASSGERCKVGYSPPRTDDPHSSEKPWWRRVFGG
jgi:hypothetical protein